MVSLSSATTASGTYRYAHRKRHTTSVLQSSRCLLSPHRHAPLELVSSTKHRERPSERRDCDLPLTCVARALQPVENERHVAAARSWSCRESPLLYCALLRLLRQCRDVEELARRAAHDEATAATAASGARGAWSRRRREELERLDLALDFKLLELLVAAKLHAASRHVVSTRRRLSARTRESHALRSRRRCR